MTPEAKQWRDHFAACEADQLQRFPLREPQTPLERAQYQLALSYCRGSFPLDRLREIKVRLGPRSSSTATAFCADEPTRCAFFEHFQEDRVVEIFCLRREEWKAVFEAPLLSASIRPYSTRTHEFINCLTLDLVHLKHLLHKEVSQALLLDGLFMRSWSSIIGPLAGEGGDDLWHWNGDKLVHLPEYGSMWVS